MDRRHFALGLLTTSFSALAQLTQPEYLKNLLQLQTSRATKPYQSSELDQFIDPKKLKNDQHQLTRKFYEASDKKLTVEELKSAQILTDLYSYYLSNSCPVLNNISRALLTSGSPLDVNPHKITAVLINDEKFKSRMIHTHDEIHAIIAGANALAYSEMINSKKENVELVFGMGLEFSPKYPNGRPCLAYGLKGQQMHTAIQDSTNNKIQGYALNLNSEVEQKTASGFFLPVSIKTLKYSMIFKITENTTTIGDFKVALSEMTQIYLKKE